MAGYQHLMPRHRLPLEKCRKVHGERERLGLNSPTAKPVPKKNAPRSLPCHRAFARGRGAFFAVSILDSDAVPSAYFAGGRYVGTFKTCGN